MRTRYGISPWIDTFPRSRRPDHPRLRGELTADVVIVGGGLTGCATAYACAVAGLEPIVIEADRLGQGSCGPWRRPATARAWPVFQRCHRASRASNRATDLRGLAARIARRSCADSASENPVRSRSLRPHRRSRRVTTGKRCGGNSRREPPPVLTASGCRRRSSANRQHSKQPVECASARPSCSIPIARVWGWRQRRSRAAHVFRAVARHEGSCGRQTSGGRPRRRTGPSPNGHRVHRNGHPRIQAASASLQTA